MEPGYMSENRYTHLIGSWRRPASYVYVAETPEGSFERHLQDLFVEGNLHLQHEELTLALQAFQEAMATILHMVHPKMPVDPNHLGNFRFPLDVALVDPLVLKAADILRKTAPVQYVFPSSVVSGLSILSQPAQESLKLVSSTGLQVTSFHDAVETNVNAGLNAASRKDWKEAITHYQAALRQTPAGEQAIRGSLQHDLAVLSDKGGDRAKAQEFGQASVDAFAQAKITDAQAQALATTAGIFSRSGNPQRATELTQQLEKIRSTTILSEVVTARPSQARLEVRDVSRPAVRGGTIGRSNEVRRSQVLRTSEAVAAAQELSLDPSAPELIGLKFVAEAATVKSLTIKGLEASATIGLEAAGALASMNNFLTTLAETKDLGLLTAWLTPTQSVAYVPHMYFFILPMSIGDCYAGMGNLEDARDSYASVLPYPFINKNYEIVKVWTRLAQTFLDLGDRAYRNAKDNPAGYAAAKAFYENIVRTNKTLNAASPLYANAKLSGIKTRVTDFLAAADPVRVNDNPSILAIVLDAFGKLSQINAGLNFFGFSPDYVPPFSFEYLQNTARYFSQHASQTEQRYIQYKSQAENEEFRREQLNQQAEVARQSVILEQRGLTEALRGIDVAQQSLDYAAVQVQNAIESKTDFNNARWELLELSTLEAWAGASSVDRDDQVKLSISGYEYFSADSQRRNVVLKELAYQRTLLTHDLEAARLDRAIASAQAYQGVAQAQVGQAQARKRVAEQRVVIAQLQERQAEENRDFLDMREFGARLWYELAQQARRITQRYLDMGTEIAFLMERAYNAETERGLSVIRYDYQSTTSGNLMGADMLLADIDSFTFDYVTTTKTKKIPVKATLSLADAFPTQFHRLQSMGTCMFETSFADFDRRHPGLYLAKVRNVEVVFVGLAGVRGLAGTLRNIGVSRFRSSGGAVVNRLYPADVMVLSQYEIRTDALAFRFNPNDLRLFENNGIETLWQLDLPLDANDFDYREILDVQLVLYYDGFFDRALEAQLRAALPASGSASRATSMKFSVPDELFYLKNQGEGELLFDAGMFPRNQKDLKRTAHTLKLTGRPQTVQNLKLRLSSDAAGGEMVLTTDANGEALGTAAGSPLQALAGQPVLDRWLLRITAADNPHLVQNGTLDLSGLDDLMVFFEYQFNYR